METIILGIDPGIATTGYGFVREEADNTIVAIDFGVIATPAHTSVPSRLQRIYREVRALIELHKPTTSGVEKLLFGKNVTTAMAVGQARGVTLLAMADMGLEIAEYTPATVKEAVAGYGNASKSQVQDMVRLLLNLDEVPHPDDAADALAIAITHLNSIRYQQHYTE